MKLSLIGAALLIAGSAAAMAQTPPTSNQARKDVQAQKQDPLAIQNSAPMEWDAVQGHDKGYLTKQDALPNSWLATNFVNCDADHDGKVTQAEYQKCKKKQQE